MINAVRIYPGHRS